MTYDFQEEGNGPQGLQDGYVKVVKLPGNSTYMGKICGGCMHGYGVLKTELDVYTGGFFENQRHGHGVFCSSVDYHPTGVMLYDGGWHMDERQGTGIIKWCSGDTYEGPFYKGKPHGASGCYTFTDGRVYRGEYKMGICHGNGRLTQTNGEYYEGEFKEGAMTGCGKGWYAGGNRVFEGFWENGKKVRGQMKFKDSCRMYDGEWKDEKPHGVGEMIFANGDHYIGEFKMGKLHGNGTITYHSAGGKIYRGSFFDDQPHGKGTITISDGTTVEGYFQRGKKLESTDMTAIRQVVRDTTPPVTSKSNASENDGTENRVSSPKRVRFILPVSGEAVNKNAATVQDETKSGERLSQEISKKSIPNTKELSTSMDSSNLASLTSSMTIAEISMPTLPSLNSNIQPLEDPENNTSSSLSKREIAEIMAISASIDPESFIYGRKGWLDKFSIGRSHIGRSNWRRRYFVLAPFNSVVSLSYYRDELCSKPAAFLRLNTNSTRIVTRPSPGTHKEAKMPGREICVIYVEKDVEYKLLLRADSEEVYASWADALRELFGIIDYPSDCPL